MVQVNPLAAKVGALACQLRELRLATAIAMSALIISGLLGIATPAAAQVQDAVEYGFANWWEDCEWDLTGPTVCYPSVPYFVTSLPDEIAALDAGALDQDCCGVWQRTGATFKVWSGPESGALPTCRFYNPTFYDVHFYTPYAAECAAVQAHREWRWQYEGIAFYLQVPDEDGNCPAGTTILYRLYFTRGWPYHRLTTSVETFNEMRAWGGWVFEGDGRTFAFACVPPSAAPAAP